MVEEEKEKKRKKDCPSPFFQWLFEIGPQKNSHFSPQTRTRTAVQTVAKRKDTIMKRTADIQTETEQITLKSKDNADCLLPTKESSSVYAKSPTNTEKSFGPFAR